MEKKKYRCVLTLLILFTCLSTNSLAQKNNRFIFKGHIEGADTFMVYLQYKDKNDVNIVDSCKLCNESFKFIGKINEPTLASFWEDKKPHSVDDLRFVEVYLEPGIITGNFDYNNLKTGKISGSDSQKESQILDESIKPVGQILDSVKQRLLASTKENKNKKLLESLRNKEKLYRKKYTDVVRDFIYNHPSSYISIHELFILQSGDRLPSDSIEFLYLRLAPKVQQSRYGKFVLKNIRKNRQLEIGKTAPNFVQNDLYGDPVSLDDFRGQYVLLEFWASWCVPCLEQIPYLIKAYKRYNKNNFTIIGISIDTDLAKWKKAVKKEHLPWTQLSDLKGMQNSVAQKYNVTPIPDNFLVDPTGG